MGRSLCHSSKIRGSTTCGSTALPGHASTWCQAADLDPRPTRARTLKLYYLPTQYGPMISTVISELTNTEAVVRETGRDHEAAVHQAHPLGLLPAARLLGKNRDMVDERTTHAMTLHEHRCACEYPTTTRLRTCVYDGE